MIQTEHRFTGRLEVGHRDFDLPPGHGSHYGFYHIILSVRHSMVKASRSSVSSCLEAERAGVARELTAKGKTTYSDQTRTQRPPINPPPLPPNPASTLLTQNHQRGSSADGLDVRAAFKLLFSPDTCPEWDFWGV